MPLTEDQIKAATFGRPAAVPVSAGILPAVWIKYRDELDG